jgi:hypothetical protein
MHKQPDFGRSPNFAISSVCFPTSVRQRRRSAVLSRNKINS